MNITEGITDYIKTELAPATSSEIALDTSLIGEGLLDSTAMLQLVLWVEDTYGFPVEDIDMTPETFGTIRNLSEYVKKNLNGKAGGE